ncbi:MULTISPECIES: hypothetical protein [Mesorhizobium]|uniref:Uncharacterized protein n=1 Tax=Mesorhizobium denitrificans TaxID=2294114 RepID=A0A371XC32_9HYPH|nr:MULTISPECIES: hypothetical protein [Mesorhizobium]RFC66796.1 hypothetical protein DY251_14795 [Mesorhizobium denitrificans]
MRYALPAFGLAILMGGNAYAAQGADPSWPCIQRKVPELSMGQIWNGPDLTPAAADWQNDKGVSELVTELAARRVPIADAQTEIRGLPQKLGPDKLSERLKMLVQGLFDHMNRERSQVISGIGRYAQKQRDLAAELRKEASQLGELQAKPGADQQQVSAMVDRLNWETRVFEERVQSLTYVCEVPTIIEQRLYALAKTIGEVMPKE